MANRVFVFKVPSSDTEIVAIPEDKILSLTAVDLDSGRFVVNGKIVAGDFNAFIKLLGEPVSVS